MNVLLQNRCRVQDMREATAMALRNAEQQQTDEAGGPCDLYDVLRDALLARNNYRKGACYSYAY